MNAVLTCLVAVTDLEVITASPLWERGECHWGPRSTRQLGGMRCHSLRGAAANARYKFFLAGLACMERRGVAVSRAPASSVANWRVARGCGSATDRSRPAAHKDVQICDAGTGRMEWFVGYRLMAKIFPILTMTSHPSAITTILPLLYFEF